MEVHPSHLQLTPRSHHEHVVEITIHKKQIEQKGLSVFPVLMACGVQPFPKMTDAGDVLSFRFHLEDWNNVVNDFLDARKIAFDNFHVLTEETIRAKDINFYMG